ncbi:indolepyruvate ferredoxin oxidoreductase family protein [Phytohabitans flavus]|uniref:indolepyruvate ferredoxin oxidoreductase family protein n=1 Tax=Phytohabitans flavus TaxID=1076124 RepID=UPI003627657F
MTATVAGPLAPGTIAPTERTVDEKYLVSQGRIFLTGVQALARVVLDQMRADRRAGLHTAALVSGYQGSPIAAFGQHLDAAVRLEPGLPVVHQPGQNEELGATAVWGSQLVGTLPRPRYQGVLGVWYGKAPGVDRAADALRHGNACGADPTGGLLALCGDDPQCKSSTLPSASESMLATLGMPVLYPANVQEILDFGLHAIAESRASGLWVALKLVANVADSNGTADVAPYRIRPILPVVEYAGRPYRHTPSGVLLAPASLEIEATMRGPRLATAKAYARENHLDRVTGATADAWFGVATAGATYFDVLEALRRLGLPEPELERRGIRLLKLAQIWPLDDEVVTRFAHGLEEILVAEEKTAFVETGIKNALYPVARHPLVTGKHDERGAPLIPNAGTLDVDLIAAALARRLHRLGVQPTRPRPAPLTLLPAAPRRTAAYCSGCPHSQSTAAPDGAVVGVGIGCHTMVILNPSGRGELAGLTQMGGEGAQWIGQAPFTDTPHIFQNLGDGTYVHSGSLAIRAAVAAGVNITFKLLLNGAVAMTGGQSLQPALGMSGLSRQLESEGVRQVIITTDEPRKYDRVPLSSTTTVRDRADLLAAQRELAAVPGVTVLVHDQQCAAEKRRMRKRGRLPTPTRRVLINPRVCEGCGDCGRKSGCLSVRPVETEYGRKTAIHQSSCNHDHTCVKGDCPSFVSVWPDSQRRPTAVPPPTDLPAPATHVAGDATVRLIGVGGTGLVTVAQILGMAAFLDGRHVRGLDQTGLAQKGGPVVSDVRIFAQPPAHANRAASATADVYLGLDLLGAANPQNLATARPGSTVAVVSTSQIPTVSMVLDPVQQFGDAAQYRTVIDSRTRPEHNVYLDAQDIAERLCGDAIAANTVMLGAAWQHGALPVSLRSLEQAIRMNGVEVERTLAAFRWGRCAVAFPDTVGRRRAASGTPVSADAVPAVARAFGSRLTAGGALDRLLTSRAGDLIAYQDDRYAAQYLAFVAHVYDREQAVVPGVTDVTTAAARNLYKLMAYKDEYEVARLSLDPDFVEQVRGEFGRRARVAFHLQPPILRVLGLRRKITLGPWFRPVLRMLVAMRRLRGTRFDMFGRTEVRRLERQLVVRYRESVLYALDRLRPDNHSLVVDLAEAPDLVRGYEQLKLASTAEYRDRVQRLLAQLEKTSEHRGG